ncbi:ferritin family protein [Geomonas sp.]|uniref:ferritin-like domain-containing protein n=1 Tax=Geomonas sp. TaxID=2651584 RepID=UPI002B483192|nr:ferritin family protein [Geomonas sp.]HJV33602.1 ferritin family protein [Geomonas sp.]
MNVFDFAMKMELQGKACYEEMAASTKVPGFRTIFRGLAADEQKHFDIFRDLKEGKTFQMVNSRAIDHARTVFTELIQHKDLIEKELHEDLDAYHVGLKMEADSIKLYEEMATKEANPEIVQLYLKMANEEKKHYNIIENICDFVMRPKYYLEWREFSNLHEL